MFYKNILKYEIIVSVIIQIDIIMHNLFVMQYI